MEGLLRSSILAASRSDRIEKLVTNAPVSREVVRRYVGGATTDAAVEATRALVKDGLTVTLDHLGEDTTDRAQADAVAAAYRELLTALDDAGLTERRGPLTARVEVSVKLSAVGQALGADGDKIALDHARDICAAAEAVGATVTLDAEDHTTTDSTLGVLAELRADFPATGSGAAGLPRSAPRATAATSPPRAAGCGCARARTRNRPASPTRRRPTSTCPTCGAPTS